MGNSTCPDLGVGLEWLLVVVSLVYCINDLPYAFL